MRGASNGSLAAFVAGNRDILTTTDGATYTKRTSGLTTGSVNFLHHFNGNFLVGGSSDGLISVSATGTSWGTKDTGLSGTTLYAAFGADIYVIARSEEIRVSEDLTTWDAAITIPAEWDSGIWAWVSSMANSS